MQNVDLHMHSLYSDGSFEPDRLVALAKEAGVEMVSLTDHDEIAGLPQMRKAAEAAGIKFVTGVEITTHWGPRSIHIVGLNFDENNDALRSYLQAIRDERVVRAKKIADKLAELGMPGALEGAHSLVTNPNLISRNHFAGWLAAAGYVKDRQEAFDKWVGNDAPAFVPCLHGRLEEAVGVIVEAGGTPVLAHPGRYKLEGWALQELLDAFKRAGGNAIEVTTGSHLPEDVPKFAQICREQGFEASSGSDFHYYSSRAMVGCQGLLPSDLIPVWHRF